jgi:hypothetical protein
MKQREMRKNKNRSKKARDFFTHSALGVSFPLLEPEPEGFSRTSLRGELIPGFQLHFVQLEAVRDAQTGSSPLVQWCCKSEFLPD